MSDLLLYPFAFHQPLHQRAHDQLHRQPHFAARHHQRIDVLDKRALQHRQQVGEVDIFQRLEVDHHKALIQ